VVSLAGLLAKDESAIEPRMVGGHSLSPAEQLGLVLWALAHYHAAGRLPDEVPVRRLLGPLDPIDPVDPVDPVDRPGPTAGNALLSGASVPAGEVVQAAAQASERCSLQAALPAAIQVGHLQARPGRFMRLAAGTLVVAAGGRSAGTEITMPRGGEAPELATREDVARLRYQGTWSIFPPEFRGDRLLAQVRSQTWSAKPA
jgi:hypothetical protein